MHQPDYADFREVLELQAAQWPTEISDALVSRYWTALKDLPLETVKACGMNHLRYGRRFPNPVDLRPRTERGAPTVENPESARKVAAARQASQANWDRLLREDDLGTLWLLLEAYLGRTEATLERSDLVYAERLSFARTVAERLLARDPEYPRSHWNAWRVLMQLFPLRANAMQPLLGQTQIAL